MEHEVFVPVPVDRLREALADPARVARAVPGLQQDAGAEPIAGRLKVRVGSHSVTYRGSVRVSGQDDGSYAVEGDAVEARGTGAVKLALTIRVREADESSDSGSGSTVTFDGTASADGRVTELPPDAVASAVGRLLSRFAENLGAAAEEPQEPEATKAPEPEAPEPEAAPEPPSVFETEVPPPPLSDASEDLTEPVVPPAEAAHARRTMIGRSAEEVDHAPPRGRYAPVPAPHTGGANSALRWAAPAAALVLASAVVVGRALRRRR
ncbi:SRPBCC domain-containing protein [Streptomyces sp. V4I2]|uniref:SRPBCC domain-containing protein n=1 Tax=Streptomyces sp. V4I2 TaxID=3042280 RepID=UPI002783E2CB|nr:SRPBCC domain-containing protein [Streptomyces sp. V4I2]MDQ1047271.1 carbon monoxide dehydrogenase subunit G [Streptomyces sp. V4I2]